MRQFAPLLRRAAVPSRVGALLPFAAPSRGASTYPQHPLAATHRLHARMAVSGLIMASGALYYVFYGFRKDLSAVSGASPRIKKFARPFGAARRFFYTPTFSPPDTSKNRLTRRELLEEERSAAAAAAAAR